MMIQIQKIKFPFDCIVIKNDFFNYDPVKSFNETDSLKYLNEDLLQCYFKDEDILIDLGWYGNIKTNKGEFRIHIIKHENWEVPLKVIYSKSVVEIKKLLLNILQYYSCPDVTNNDANL